MLGLLLQNQATSLFAFTIPDRPGGDSLYDAGRSPLSQGAGNCITTRALRVAADRHVTAGSVMLESKSAVGQVARTFDRPIACATR